MTFLLTQQPNRAQKYLAIAVALTTAGIFLALAPFATKSLPPIPLFVPIYQSALALCDFITAILLLGQFRIVRSQSLLFLAAGYLFSAWMAALHAASYLNMLPATSWFAARSQTTPWLYVFWHLGFPAALIAYARTSNSHASRNSFPEREAKLALVGTIAGVIVLVFASLFVATFGGDALPVLMQGDAFTSAERPAGWAIWLVTLAALPALWRRGHYSALDLWLMLVIAAWSFDITLSAVMSNGRFSVGWYSGRIYGLLASTFLLAVFILQNGELYRRLIQSYAKERRQRRLVEKRTSELNSLNQALEQRVQERTTELELSNRELERSKQELEEYATVGATVREQERRRLARELHDQFNQSLVLMKIELSRLEKHCNLSNPLARKTAASLHDIIDHSLADAQRMAADLRPLILDDLGFTPAVQSLVEHFTLHHHVRCNLSMQPEQIDLREPYSTTLFRILQESLANVARHAEATRVDITLNRSDHELKLHIHDNGIGFDTAVPRKANSFGLVGVRERVRLVSGRIVIDSTPGHGTTIDVQIPTPLSQAI